MVVRGSDSLYDVYTRDGKVKIASGVTLQEVIKLECKVKSLIPEWVQDIERKRDASKAKATTEIFQGRGERKYKKERSK